MSDFFQADQQFEKDNLAKIRAQREAVDPLSAAPAVDRKAEATASAEGMTSDFFGTYDLKGKPEDATRAMRFRGLSATSPGALDYQYLPDSITSIFKDEIAKSTNPTETEARLNTAFYLSRLQGISFDEAYTNQDSLLHGWYNRTLEPRTAWEATKNVWVASTISNQASTLADQLWDKYAGKDLSKVYDDPIYKQIAELMAKMPPEDRLKEHLPIPVLNQVAQVMPSMINSLQAGAVGGIISAGGVAGIAALSAAIAGTGGVSIPLIALSAFGVGSGVFGAKANYHMERGSAFLQMLQYEDPVSHQKINPAIAHSFSDIYGAFAMTVEMFQTEKFLMGFGLDAAGKALVKAAIKESSSSLQAAAERSGIVQRAFMRFTGKALQGLGGELAEATVQGLQEAVQQGGQDLAQEFAKQVTNRLEGKNLSPATIGEIASDMGASFVGAAVGTLGMKAPKGVVRILSGAKTEANQAGREKVASAYSSAEEKPSLNTTPEDPTVFSRRAEEPLPEGTYIQPREVIEGSQYILKAGNKDSGERQGFVRYEIAPDTQTVTVLGFENGRAPNVNAFLLRGLSARFPGWNIEMDPKSPGQAALRDYMTSRNPRGPEARLSYYEAPRETPARVTMDYLKGRIKEVAPGWAKEDIDLAANVLPMWARKMGMTADELANSALTPQVFGQILDKSQAAAQAATGAFKPVRTQEGLFKGLIDMAPTANPSTAIHEMTHAVITFARQAQDTPQVAQFLKELEGALGVKDGNWDAPLDIWTDQYKGRNRSAMEALTYGMEDYFATGKAPTPELEGLFRKLAQWVLDIYEGMKGARVKMSPELTAYFDDLVGGEGSPYRAQRQTLSEGDLATEARALQAGAPSQGQENSAANASTEGIGPENASMARFERPPIQDLEIFQNERRREIAGSQRDLEEARARLAAGEDPATVRAETGWSDQDGEMRLDKGFKPRPEYETSQEERARQEGIDSGEAPLGPAAFTEKAYPPEGPTEDSQDPISLFQGDTEEIGNLVAVHNMSARSIELAKKIGGLAMPSLAVIRKDIPFGSFGEITLIAPKSMVDPKYSSETKVFNADIYSPRYPSASYTPDQKKLGPIAEKIAEALAPIYAKSKDEYYRKRPPTKWGIASTLEDLFDRHGLADLEFSTELKIYWLSAIEGSKKGLESLRKTYLSEEQLPRFKEWAASTFTEAIGEPKIFKGFTNSGNRRYVPFTIENVFAEMKKAGLQGGEQFQYGLPSIRALVAKQYKTLESMSKDQGKIISDAEFEEAKKETNALFEEIMARSEEVYKGEGHYSFIDAFQEGVERKAVGSVLKSHGFEFTQEDLSKVNLLLSTLRTMPTEYFEAKVKRIVGLKEFLGAVIPSDSDQKTRDILASEGLKIAEYKPGDLASRAAAVTGLSFDLGAQDVLFQGDFGKPLPVEEGMASQGIKALLKAKQDYVANAVHRDELGWIDIPWGVPGDLDRDYAGGWGLSHIQAKHEYTDQVIDKIPLILRQGRVVQDPKFRNRRDIIFGRYMAVVQLGFEGDSRTWLVTAYIPEAMRRKNTPAESGQQTVRPADTGTASPSPARAAEGGDAAGRSPPANGRKAIVKRRPGPGNTLDRNDIKPDEPLFQKDDGLTSSSTRTTQGAGIDEAGVSSLKDLARTFPTWEEFATYMDAMEADNPDTPQDMAPRERLEWFKELWTQARQVKAIDLEDWTRSLEADGHRGLLDFLEGIWNEILIPGAMKGITSAQAEDVAQADKARDTKAGLAETIVAAAQRVGGGNTRFDARFLASLMGTIRKNPEEYARIYGEVMGQPEIAALGAQAEAEKYADIKDPRLTTRMSISQKAALGAQIRDEKLASEVLSGRVTMDEKVKEYLVKMKAQQKSERKKIADLEAEIRASEAGLSSEDRRLAAARAEAARTGQEIARTKRRLERFVEKGQKVPRGYEQKTRLQEERAKAIRGQLARAGDFQELDNQAKALDRRIENVERRIAEDRAYGTDPTSETIALRSRLQAERRALEPRLAAAGIRWKDSAGLQTHLAKVEGLAKAQEKYQVREAEIRALSKVRAYQEKLTRAIMRPVGDGIYVAQAKAISMIQQMVDPHFRSERTQADIDALRSELEANPDLAREVPREWLRRAAAKNLNEYSLQELEDMASKVQSLRSLGKALKTAQAQERADWAESRASEIVDAIMASPGYKTPTGYEAEKSFAEKFKDKVRTVDFAFLNMRRVANRLDGGKDGTNVELLWHEMNRRYRRELEGSDRRTQTIMEAFKKAEVDPREWYNTTVDVAGAGPGGATKTLRKSDLLALEMAFRDEDSRAHALFGNFFSKAEKKEHEHDEDWLMAQGQDRFEALRKAIDSVLTDKDMKVLDAMAADAKSAGARLAEVVASVENRVFQTVENYFPCLTLDVTQDPMDIQIAGDMLNRTPGLRRPPKNGFTRARTKIGPAHQQAIKLDLLSTWLSSIQAQEHYIATADYGKKLDAVYTNSFMQEQIKAVLGDPGVDYVKEYIAEVKNPGSLRDSSRWEQSIRYLRGNLGAAYLTFRASSTLKQIITSPWPTLPYAGPRMLSESFRCLANPVKFLRDTEEMSTILKHRSHDLVMQAVKEAKAASPAGAILLGAEKIGMKGLELADRFSVAIGWRACYEKALQEFKGDTVKAVEKADDLILKSQPSSRGVDLAPIYRKGGEPMKLLLQFTQAVNIIWQNIRYDVPNAVKNHQFGTALGILISYAIAGSLLNAMTSEPPEDETDEQKARRLLFWTITQGTDSIPLIGQDVTRLARHWITGEKTPTYPNTALPGIAEMLDGLYKLDGENWEKGLETFARGAGTILGVPTSGIKEIYRVSTGDFSALLGRQGKK